MTLPAKQARAMQRVDDDDDDDEEEDYNLGRTTPGLQRSVEGQAAAEFLDGLGRAERERIGREAATALKKVLDNEDLVPPGSILYFDKPNKSGSYRHVLLRISEHQWKTTALNPKAISGTDRLIVWMVAQGVPHISPLFLAHHGQGDHITIARL